MERELANKIRTYNAVQRIVQNLAEGGKVYPFAGVNTIDSRAQSDLFRDLALSRNAGVEWGGGPRTKQRAIDLSGFEFAPNATSVNLRTPSFRQGFDEGRSLEVVPAQPRWYEGWY